jgi:hypothetical protein
MAQIGKRRSSNYGMLRNFLTGRLATQALKVTTVRDADQDRQLAALAGRQGVSARPMDNARRAENYRRQRGGLAPVLTDRQRRRLRKNSHVGVTATGAGKAFG